MKYYGYSYPFNGKSNRGKKIKYYRPITCSRLYDAIKHFDTNDDRRAAELLLKKWGGHDTMLINNYSKVLAAASIRGGPHLLAPSCSCKQLKSKINFYMIPAQKMVEIEYCREHRGLFETILLMGFLPNGAQKPYAGIHIRLLRSCHSKNMVKRMSIEEMGKFVTEKFDRLEDERRLTQAMVYRAYLIYRMVTLTIGE